MMEMPKTKWIITAAGLLIGSNLLLGGCQTNPENLTKVKQNEEQIQVEFVPIQIDGKKISSLKQWKEDASKQGIATMPISKEDEISFIFHQLVYQANRKVIDTSKITSEQKSDKALEKSTILVPYVFDRSVIKYLEDTYGEKVDRNPEYFSHDGYIVGATSTKDSKVNEAILKEKMTHIQSKNDYLKLNSQDTQFIQFFDLINMGNPTKYDQATIRYLQELEGKSSGIPIKLSIDKLQEYPELQNIIQSKTEYIEHNDILYIQHVESGLVKPKIGRILQEIELYHQDNAQQNTNQNLIKILKAIVEENPNIKIPDSFYTEYLLPKMKQDKKGTQSLKEYPDVLFKSIYPYYIK